MNLSLTEEQTMIQGMARKFAGTVLEPVAASLDCGNDEQAERVLFLENLNNWPDSALWD